MNHADGRRVRKVSRACDACKSHKIRCPGTKPCDRCTSRRLVCSYDAPYLRGRPPTPSRATSAAEGSLAAIYESVSTPPATTDATPRLSGGSRGEDVRLSKSPDSDATVIHGQYVDPTSGISFIRRAQRQFLHNTERPRLEVAAVVVEKQPMMLAGDKPLVGTDRPFHVPNHEDVTVLLDLYFDVCVATYRILHRPTIDSWLLVVEANLRANRPVESGLGRSKSAIILGILAIATFHQSKREGRADDEGCLLQSDCLMREAFSLTNAETGLPQLESVQARLIQVFYLLMTSRMSRAWYVFGSALQIISALGMHRLSSKWRLTTGQGDYIGQQCGLRTFWTAYILDRYLGVVLGRPLHFHDEDIDLDLPDCVNDGDMTFGGSTLDTTENCHIEAFVCNAKLARIVGKISRELYPLKPKTGQEQLKSVGRLNRELDAWHASVPHFLRTVRPSSLVRCFRRQSIALKVARCHAIMHLNRPSLLHLGGSNRREADTPAMKDSLDRCLSAAEEVLQIVDGMAQDGPLFHAFWWTHYVAFCALSITYVWEIQRITHPVGKHAADIFEIRGTAERCQSHLSKATATNSPGRRYSAILEELRSASNDFRARRSETMPQPEAHGQNSDDLNSRLALQPDYETLESNNNTDNMLDDWQATDWLNWDASAFGPFDYDLPGGMSWTPVLLMRIELR